MPQAPPDRATWIGFLSMVVLIGLNIVFVRVSNAELDPFWGATIRYVLATLVILLALAVLRLPLPRGPALRVSVLYGVLNHGIFFAAMYWALVLVPASAAAIALAAVPLATYLMAAALRIERLTFPGLLGAAIVIVGIGVIASDGLRAQISPLRYLALVLAVLATATAAVLVKRGPPVNPIAMNAVGIAAGTVVLALLTLVTQPVARLPETTAVRAAVVFLAFSSVLLFVLMVWLIRRWTASGVAYAGVLAPFVTAGVAHFVLNEPVTWRLIVGGVLVLAGVYWGALRRHQAVAPAPVASVERAP